MKMRPILKIQSRVMTSTGRLKRFLFNALIGGGVLFTLFILESAFADRGTFSGSTVEERIEFKSIFRSSSRPPQEVNITGTLMIPPLAEKVPAMVLVHGSGGLRENRFRYAPELNSIGVALFLIDCFTPRGVKETITDQSRVTNGMMVADAFAALKVLSEHPRIDPDRIGIMGFSKGGGVAITTAFEISRRSYISNHLKFAVHVAFYPGCSVQFRNVRLTGAPLLMLLGGEDDWAPAITCQSYAEKLRQSGAKVDVIVYPEGHHGWDSDSRRQWLPKAQNYSRCLTEMDEKMRLFDMKTGAEISDISAQKKFYERCMTLGATVEANPRVRDKAIADLKQYLNEVFFKKH